MADHAHAPDSSNPIVDWIDYRLPIFTYHASTS